MKRYGRTEKRRKRNDPFDRFVFVCTKRNAKFILAPTVYIYIGRALHTGSRNENNIGAAAGSP